METCMETDFHQSTQVATSQSETMEVDSEYTCSSEHPGFFMDCNSTTSSTCSLQPLEDLPGEILLKCTPSQSARLLCAHASRNLRQKFKSIAQEWVLGANATDKTLRAITNVFSSLTAVNINPTGTLGSPCRGVAGDGMAALGKLHRLKKLELNYVTGLQNDELVRLTEDKRCLMLGSLKLEYGLAMTESSAFAIAAVCPNLTTLSIGISGVTDAGLIEVAERCPGLTSIALRNCYAVTDAAVLGVATRCPHLTRLQLANSKQITDAGLVAIAQRCKLLTELDISQLEVGDSTMLALGRFSERLKSLDISWFFPALHSSMKESSQQVC